MTTAEKPLAGTGTDIHWRSVNAIRFLAVDAVQKAASGHPGAPLGMAPMAYVLWKRIMRHSPANPDWPDRDRFVLSAGHASMLLYSLLNLTGYELPLEQIKRFRQLGSLTPGHPERGLTPGVEATTGPLGQGFANGVGFAIAESVLGSTYNRDGHKIIDHHTYAIVSDGDLQEGVQSEAASLAGTLGLGKIVYLYDDNDISIEGNTDVAFRENAPARFEAYGWQVLGPVDGNDLDGIERAIRQGKAETEQPTLIVVKSVIGYGSPNKAGTGRAHGEPLGEEEVSLTRQALGWPHGPFEVPDDVVDHMHECVDEGARLVSEWSDSMAVYAGEFPELAQNLKDDLAGTLPPSWNDDLTSLLGSFGDPIASRAVSGKALHAIAPALPRLIGGSADLAPSNNTNVAGRGSYQVESPEGRNLHFGVREHGMAAIANGMALHGGLIPYAATFLVFSDYMRGAIRVGALSEAPVIWIFTHDSIGLGEDGPTHQPVAELMALRLIPNLTVLRPADADETIESWRLAIENRSGPTALILTRQALPPLAAMGAQTPASGNVERGAYIVRDGDGQPDVILIATGSEVQLALAAAATLEQDGLAVRVLSMPSFELFQAQSEEYRAALLPPSVRARVAVEAGTTMGWDRYVGLDGAVVGMTGYGASGPGGEVMRHFGFTAEHVAEVARNVLGRGS